MEEEKNSEGAAGKKAVLVATSARHWAGPLPPPEVLEAFGKVSPNAVDMILRNALEEARHRREIESSDSEFIRSATMEDMEKVHKGAERGQRIAAGVTYAVIAAAVVCAFLGQKEIGCTIAGIGLANLAAVFIGREYRTGRKERDNGKED